MTTIRPTGRAIVAAVCAVALWILADLTRVMHARVLAAALLLTLAVGGACSLLVLVRLRVRRRVLDDVAPVGARARVQADLADGALISTLPLGRGVLRQDLPEALGGRGDLPLAYRMPHGLTVARRGTHRLGSFSIVVRDVFGMFHLRRTADDDARIIGLPVTEEIDRAAALAAGIAHQDRPTTASSPGLGDIGPIARPYASGDDIRRVHWRASARTGSLMTREEEPPSSRTALIVLDNRGGPEQRAGKAGARGGPEGQLEKRGMLDRQPGRRPAKHPQQAPPPTAAAAQDRLVDHVASVLASLRAHGWEVHVVDADGAEIIRAERGLGTERGLGPEHGLGRGGGSVLGREADAVAERAALIALADVSFEAVHQNGRTGRPAEPDRAGQAAGPRAEHATGSPQLVVAFGIDHGTPFDDLELDRFAGRARHRIAIALAPTGPAAPAAPAAPAGPAATAVGTWTLVRGHPEHSVNDLLTAASSGDPA